MKAPTSEDKAQLALHFLGQEGIFKSYFGVYEDLARQDDDLALPISWGTSTELTHTDIIRTSSLIMHNIHVTRSELQKSLQYGNGMVYSVSTVDKAINIAIQSMIMVDSAATEWHSADFVVGETRPTCWLPDETYLSFVQRCFDKNVEVSSRSIRSAVEQKAAMKAWKLQRRLGLRFRPTNNIADHLLHDPRRNCLYLFHHTSFLKAHLEKFRDDTTALKLGIAECLPRGVLPPQLLVETLHSLQAILFPSIDQVSAPILDDLIAKCEFDTDCVQYEGYRLFFEPPQQFEYVYWGDRLAYIHGLLMGKHPRNRIERWFQWQSSEGNALFVALMALLISVILTILSLIVACVQTWIAWMAWKRPVVVASN